MIPVVPKWFQGSEMVSSGSGTMVWKTLDYFKTLEAFRRLQLIAEELELFRNHWNLKNPGTPLELLEPSEPMEPFGTIGTILEAQEPFGNNCEWFSRSSLGTN